MTSPDLPPKLGIILPDEPVPLEMLRLGPWLEARQRTDVAALTLSSLITGGHTEEVLRKAGDLETIGPVGQALAEQGCGAVVWACTSGSFIGGYDWALAQAEGLARRAGCPATSTTLSFIAALEALDVKEVDLLAAYPEPVTQAFIGCLKSAGFGVANWQSLDSPDGASSFHLPLADALEGFAKGAATDRPILIPDTAIDSLDIVDTLEEATGRFVLTANQVSVWNGLRLLGVEMGIERAGRLFAHRKS